MSYPSIVSQPGSAERNVDAIKAALADLIDSQDDLQSAATTSKGPARIQRILEIGSGGCTHLKQFARRWQEVEWWPTGRNMEEVGRIVDLLRHEDGLENVRRPLTLDIGIESDWRAFQEAAERDGSSVERDNTAHTETLPGVGILQGVLMVNIIHCCPPEYPEQVFRHFSSRRADGSWETGKNQLLDTECGWIAAYSPFLSDDGSFKSEADEKFDREYIKGKDPSLGLRSIPSINFMARRWGFEEVHRREMPKGNMWVVWKRRRGGD